MEDKEVKINVDTSEVDEAIEKAKSLNKLLDSKEVNINMHFDGSQQNIDEKNSTIVDLKNENNKLEKRIVELVKKIDELEICNKHLIG